MGLLDRDPMKVPSPKDDWQERHNDAVNFPRDGHESSIVKLLRGWLDYARAYSEIRGLDIGQDAIIGHAWAAVGRDLITLLHDETGRLDSALLCRLVEIRLKSEGFRTE